MYRRGGEYRSTPLFRSSDSSDDSRFGTLSTNNDDYLMLQVYVYDKEAKLDFSTYGSCINIVIYCVDYHAHRDIIYPPQITNVTITGNVITGHVNDHNCDYLIDEGKLSLPDKPPTIRGENHYGTRKQYHERWNVLSRDDVELVDLVDKFSVVHCTPKYYIVQDDVHHPDTQWERYSDLVMYSTSLRTLFHDREPIPQELLSQVAAKYSLKYQLTKAVAGSKYSLIRKEVIHNRYGPDETLYHCRSSVISDDVAPFVSVMCGDDLGPYRGCAALQKIELNFDLNKATKIGFKQVKVSFDLRSFPALKNFHLIGAYGYKVLTLLSLAKFVTLTSEHDVIYIKDLVVADPNNSATFEWDSERILPNKTNWPAQGFKYLSHSEKGSRASYDEYRAIHQ